MSSSSDADLQFDRAEYSQETEDGLRKCVSCGTELLREYYTANGNLICPACHSQLLVGTAEGSALGRFFRATGLGLAGGAVGAAIYFAIVTLTGYEIGLVAIAVGFLVGAGVRMGSHAKGGMPYQALAVAVTYFAVVATYVPFIIEGTPSPHYSRRCRFRVPAVVNRIVNEGAGGVGREWRPCRNAGS